MAQNSAASRNRPSAPLVLAVACGICAPATYVAGQLTEPFPAVFDLESLAPSSGGDGSLGFVLEGARPYGMAGASVGSAGDVNGDGVDDLIVGAPGYDYYAAGYDPMAGWAYVIFGRDSTAGSQFPPLVAMRLLSGADGFRLTGVEAGARGEGASVSSAGDINGDGADDVMVGAQSGGDAYIVFGRDTTSGAMFPARVRVTDLDGTGGFRLNSERWGRMAVASAGDFNGDGMDDAIIGAPSAGASGGTPTGASFMVFGRSAGVPAFPAALDLSSLDGETGFRIDGEEPGDQSGWWISGAGDLNADGVDDVIISSAGADPSAAYVLFGSTIAFPPAVALAGLDGETGFRLEAGGTTHHRIQDVRSCGDLNSDGIADIVVAASLPPGEGDRAYVVFGRDTVAGAAFPPVVDLLDLEGASGFRLEGMPDSETFAVAGIGDINGDGIDDLAMNSYTWIGYYSPQDAFVLFGRDAAAGPGFPPVISVAELDGTTGFRLTGPRQAGASLAPAGDVNGDGLDDLVIGAPAEYFGYLQGQRGRAYVLFGRSVDTPCYADCDGSGALDFFDFLCFQNQFAAGDPQADCDESGELDFFDFLCFQNAFTVGCP